MLSGNVSGCMYIVQVVDLDAIR